MNATGTRPASGYFAVIVAVLIAPGVAQAQGTRTSTALEDAAWAETVRQANDALEHGNYERAATLCERAMQVRTTPALRYCVAAVAAEGSAQEPDRSVVACEQARRCVETAGEDTDRRRRAELQARCGEIATQQCARLGRVRLEVDGVLPDGATVRIGEHSIARELVGLDVPLVAGNYEVTAEATGYAPVRERVAVSAGNAAALHLHFEPLPAVPPRPVERFEPPHRQAIVRERRTWEAGVGIGALVAGGVALGWGVYGLSGHEADGPVNSTTHVITRTCAFGASTRPAANGGLECDGIGPAVPTLMAAGGLLLGVGVFLLVDGLRLRTTDTAARARPSLIVHTAGAEFGVQATF